MVTTFVSIIPFILMLGVTMITAPCVPGGAVMAAIGLLKSMLGFDPTMVSLMIALYLTQEILGTACNVTGDGAITSIQIRLVIGKNSEVRECGSRVVKKTAEIYKIPAVFLYSVYAHFHV